MGRQKVAVCGSMRFIDKMREWKDKLEIEGYEVYVPTLVDFHLVRDNEGNLEKFEEIKRRETKKHFEKVEIADILLVLNYDKNGRKDYIGGNTFGEIAYAVGLNYCHGKNIKIYTVNPLPRDSVFYEELSAWGVREWRSNLGDR